MVTVGQAYAAENREKNRKLYERLENCFSEKWKVIFVGDYGVGKSNMLLRFMYNQFNKDRYGYFGVEYASKWLEHDGKKIKVGFWDTGGSERFGALGPSHFRGVDGAFLVYDIANRASFENVETWLQKIRNKQYGGSDPVILLVGNKTDLEAQREVTTKEAKTFAEANDFLFIETSALDDTNIKDAFQILVREMLQRRFNFYCSREIKFREDHELWAALDNGTSFISILKDIARICLHPDAIMITAFLVCILLYSFYA